jgi:hypothetical protein
MLLYFLQLVTIIPNIVYFFSLAVNLGTHKNVVYASLFHTILRRILLFVSATLLHLYPLLTFYAKGKHLPFFLSALIFF